MTGWTIGSALRGNVSTRTLIIALSAPLAVAAPTCAYAGGTLPGNGQYVAGAGSIGKTGANGLTINQSTNSGIINWNSFSIGKGNTVQFNNGSGATLNRVTGGDLSTIAGSLKGTGSIYLINPQGVIVNNTGKVLTGGSFAASTRDVSNSAFMSGSALHTTGSSNGTVVVQGQIVSSNGDVTLIGNSVTNSGTVSAKNGTASLNAGNDVLLAPAGSNGRIMVSGGSGDATNSGTISAAQAQLNAAGGNVYALSGNNGGIIRATGTQNVGGHVWLTSNTGNVTATGNITTTNANGSGGSVTARGNNIVISGNVDASATKATMIGGNVSAIAANTTTVSGSIAAKGGDHGKGGQIETSGEHVHVADSARVATLGTDGLSGDWLIDPADFTIAASGGDITGATLSANVQSGSVLIESSQGTVNTNGSGDINVNDTVTYSASGTDLALDAYRNININAPILITGSARLELNVGDQSQSGGSNASLGDVVFNTGGRIAFTDVVGGNTQGNLIIDGTGYTLVNSLSQLATDVAGNAGGHYALANNYDATSDNSGTAYTGAVVGTALTGTFEGLGNTVSNVTIASTAGSSNVGLFGVVDGGTVRDITLAHANVSATGDSSFAGALAGEFSIGMIENVHVSGTLTGGSNGRVGGLIGLITANSGTSTLSGDSSSVDVTGNGLWAGGLVSDMALNGGGTLNVSDSYATGNVSGSATYLGGFAGDIGNNSGTYTITNSYATGNVSGSASNNFVGGFAGIIGSNSSDITVTGSHATGTVTGGGGNAGGFAAAIGGNGGSVTITGSYATGNTSGDEAGGFAGSIGGNGGSVTVTGSHATGSASSGSNSAGGFVGGASGNANITASYASGTVIGGEFAAAGGFVGTNLAAISDSYATGNVSTGKFGDAGGFAGIAPNGSSIQTSYSLGSATTGQFGAVGGFSATGNATSVFTNDYWDTETSGTASVGNGISAGVTGKTTAQLQGALPSGFSGTTWGTGTGLLPYLKWQFTSGTPQAVSGTLRSGIGGAGLSGQNVSLMQNGINLNSAQTGGSVVTYANGYYYFLLAPGAIASGANPGLVAYDAAQNAEAFADGANGSIAGLDLTTNYLYAQTSKSALSVLSADFAAATNGTTPAITNSLEINALGNFTIDQALGVNSNLIVVANGTLAESGSGTITAATLSGSSAGGTTLNAANQIAKLGAFTNTGSGNIALTDDAALYVTGGNVNAGTGNVALTTTGSGHALNIGGSVITGATVSLTSAGTMNETGAIDATAFIGSSVGGTALNGANLIGKLSSFTNTGGGNIALTDAEALYVSGGNVNAGTGAVTLKTTGAGHALNIGTSVVTGGTVSLTSAGTINEAGAIHATLLTGSSVGGTALTGANLIGTLGSFANTSSGNFALTDGQALIVNGAVNTGTGAVTLTSTGTIAESGSGAITAAVLTGSSAGGTTLNGANQIGKLSAFTNTGSGAIALTDAVALYVSGGNVNASTGNLALKTTGAGHALNIGSVNITGGTVTLTSAGTINETGVIHATAFTGSSAGGATLNGANQIGTLGAFTNTGSGNIALTDVPALYVSGGNVNAGTGNVTLKTTGVGHALNIGNSVITGTTVTLTSGGTINETGAIHSTTLTGSSAGGTALNGANLIGTLSTFANTNSGNFALSNGKALTVSGAVSVASSTGTLGLTTTVGNLTINGSLTAPTVTLNTAGEVLEGSAGAVTATNTLNVSAATGINLNSTHNHIHAVGTRHTTTGPNVINGVGM